MGTSPASNSAFWLLSVNTVPVNCAAAPVLVTDTLLLPGLVSNVVPPTEAVTVDVPDAGCV
jgi:hypothetical protein